MRIRLASAEDSTVCGQICYQAFSTINAAHNFPSDVPGPEAAVGLLSNIFATPGLYCVVAEMEAALSAAMCSTSADHCRRRSHYRGSWNAKLLAWVAS